jgi:hypothetical protein
MVRREGEAMCLVEEAGATRKLRHVVYHSPDGFGWGYIGSGAADLARSILTDAVGPELADDLYQDFKWEVVAGLPHEGGVITVSQVMEFVRHHRTPVAVKEPGGASS